jgi:hypothetical protein
MNAENSRFNRTLLIVMILLFGLSLAAFGVAIWVVEGENMVWWQALLNIPILAIPISLIYGSIYVLVAGWREHATQQQVSPRLANIIHRAPRIAVILIAFFLSLFSLDVFEMEATPLQLLGGFLIHNIPSFILIGLLVVAWKRPVVGFVAFLAAAVLFCLFFVRDVYSLSALLLFVLPILLIAGLFYADWRWLKPGASL